MTAKLTLSRILTALVIITMVVAFMPSLNNSDVYAKSKKVKVTFNVNGGKFTTKKYSKKAKMVKSITKGKKVGKLPKAKRTGYALKGWYTKKSGGKKVSKNTKIKKKTTYYAQWVAKDYKITFDPNGGTAPTVKTKKVKYKGRYGTLPTTKRNGYNFKGWYTARSGGTKVASTSTNTVAANDTLYAQWSGVGTNPDPNPPNPDPGKWDGVSDGNYYAFTVGENVTIVTSEKPMGLCADGVTMGYLSGTTVTVHHPEFTSDGKKFAGWVLSDPSSGRVDFSTERNTSVTIGCKNVHLYAWYF